MWNCNPTPAKIRRNEFHEELIFFYFKVKYAFKSIFTRFYILYCLFQSPRTYSHALAPSKRRKNENISPSFIHFTLHNITFRFSFFPAQINVISTKRSAQVLALNIKFSSRKLVKCKLLQFILLYHVMSIFYPFSATRPYHESVKYFCFFFLLRLTFIVFLPRLELFLGLVPAEIFRIFLFT